VPNKKLVLLSPSLGPGGLQRAISVLANYFAEHANREVYIILYGISKQQFYPLNERVQVHTPDFDFKNKKRFYYSLKTMLFIRGKIKTLKPDAVLSFGEYWNSFVLLSLLGLSYPVYISDRCQPDKSLGRVHNWLRKVLYPMAAGIILQTTTARDIYAKIIRHSNIEVIGNPIQGFVSSEGIDKENIILSVGRLIPSKHHDLLIDIFLACYEPGWKLVIAGGDVVNGNVFKQLKAKVVAMNAEDKIELTGNINHVNKYYQKSKVFAFTSSSEGFPNVIGEAMAAGLPVIAFDCVAGPSDMIDDDKNGFLIPLFDQKLFVKKLSLLMNNEQLRMQMGAAAIESIQKFNPELIGQKYNDFLFSTEIG
jgi:GalNAc-alpha-(1->4)-GalNAc-alpha-(1->3)-diNAcBac-PP-undecaprenol alpha-1,4-N-acetyl-D-galactosaminyltransferase